MEIQNEDIILARSVALMEGVTNTLQKIRENTMEFQIEKAKTAAQKIEVDPILANKPIPRIPKRKKQFDELCEDKSRTLQPVQLFSKAIKIVFGRIISEIKMRLDSATILNFNFAFLNSHKMLNMSTEELQKHGADLAQKYEQHLNTFEFCQELAYFKEQAPFHSAAAAT